MNIVGVRVAIVIPMLAVVVLGLAWGREAYRRICRIHYLDACGVDTRSSAPGRGSRSSRARAIRVAGVAVVVTVIEVALIVTLRCLSRVRGAEALARDIVLAAVMIACNGILGLSLLFGARRTFAISFNADAAGETLAVVATLCALALVLPAYIVRGPAPLAFAAVATFVVYGLFVTLKLAGPRGYFPADDLRI